MARRLTLAALTPLLPTPLEEQVVRRRAERRPLGGALHAVCRQHLLCAQFAPLLELRLVRHQQLLQFRVARGQHLSHPLSSRSARQRPASATPQLNGSKFGQTRSVVHVHVRKYVDTIIAGYRRPEEMKVAVIVGVTA